MKTEDWNSVFGKWFGPVFKDKTVRAFNKYLRENYYLVKKEDKQAERMTVPLERAKGR